MQLPYNSPLPYLRRLNIGFGMWVKHWYVACRVLQAYVKLKCFALGFVGMFFRLEMAIPFLVCSACVGLILIVLGLCSENLVKALLV